MKGNILGIVISSFLIISISIIPSTFSTKVSFNKEENIATHDTINGGWLEE